MTGKERTLCYNAMLFAVKEVTGRAIELIEEKKDKLTIEE